MKRKNKYGTEDGIMNEVIWLRKHGDPPCHYEKLKANHDFFIIFMEVICGDNQQDQDEFKAERAFYHLNPEE